jgi:hypothetical protein
MSPLEGKRALIWGGGTGIGFGFAEAMAVAGARVFIASRNAQQRRCPSFGASSTAIFYPCSWPWMRRCRIYWRVEVPSSRLRRTDGLVAQRERLATAPRSPP